MTRPLFLLEVLCVVLVAFGIMWFSAPNPRAEYDCTRRVATWLLEGKPGTEEQPPS